MMPVSMWGGALLWSTTGSLVGGYGQRLLRLRSDLLGIETWRCLSVGLVGGYGHAPFRRVIDRSVDAVRSSRSPSRDVRATP